MNFAPTFEHGERSTRFGSVLPCCGAFTLIEVLLAIAVFTIVLAAINGIFYGALHLQMATTSTLEESLPVDHAATIIKRDLANIVLPNGLIAGAITSGGIAGAPTSATLGLSSPISLELFTSTGVLCDDVPWGDIQKVDYSLQAPTVQTRNGGKDLVRSVSRNLLTTASDLPDQQRLLSDVEKLNVTFFDGTNWQPTWGAVGATNASVPAAIRFQIDLVQDAGNRSFKPPLELLVPVTVAYPVETNQ